VGPQGSTGAQGPQGATGAQGATGPVAGSANQVVYKDGSNAAAGSANLTFNGTTLTSTGLAVSNSVTAATFTGGSTNSANPAVALNGVSGSGALNLFNDMSGGAYNPIVTAGAKGIIATGANNTTTRGALVVAPWSDVGYGIRFTGGSTTDILVRGTSTFTPTLAADKALIVKGIASQAGDFIDIQNSAGTSQFKVDSAGNVGISTASPTEKLDVAGNIALTGSVIFEGATANEFETTLTVVDPTVDRTITLPNVSGTVITTGDTGSVTSTMILDGTILNANINASAAIALSKLASGTSAQVVVANASGIPTYTTISGDITISNTGVATIAANSIALGTDTTGNYMSGVTAGTGITVTHTPAEGSSATIAVDSSVVATKTNVRDNMMKFIMEVM
jgi:hypothetical protein